MLGKTVPYFVLGMLGMGISVAGGVWLFDVPLRGSILALVVVLFSLTVAVVGIGLFISAMSTTMQQGLLGAFLFIMPAVILSGFTTPIENMPDWLQIGTLANPLRYAVHALRQLFLEGLGVREVWPQIWPMWLISGVTLPAAGWMFRRRTG